MSVQFLGDQHTAIFVPIAELSQHPDNPNVGPVDAIADSIKANGFYGAIIVQFSTNRVLAGWHRTRALLQLGEELVPVSYADVDDATARRIVAGDNQLNRLGHFDTPKLADLLEQINGDGDLAGTGFTMDDLAGLLRESVTPAKAFVDDPEGAVEDAQDELQGDAVSGEPPARWFPLAFSVTAEQRDTIHRAMAEAKSRMGDAPSSPVTAGEALWSVCEWWLNGE